VQVAQRARIACQIRESTGIDRSVGGHGGKPTWRESSNRGVIAGPSLQNPGLPLTLAELDNPFWSSLRSRHRGIALGSGDWARYPPDFAPFLGVSHAGVDAGAALEPGDRVFVLGVKPEIAEGWQLQTFRPLAQMTCCSPIEPVDGPDVLPLTDAHRADVLALTALVYPHYFRERTMDMGRYFGIYQDGRLAAMIGERLGTDLHQEVSAICTHPDYLGRGYARRLTAMLSNHILEQGRLPFLHVSHENTRAKQMYEQLGYRVRIDIPFWSLRKPSNPG